MRIFIILVSTSAQLRRSRIEARMLECLRSKHIESVSVRVKFSSSVTKLLFSASHGSHLLEDYRAEYFVSPLNCVFYVLFYNEGSCVCVEAPRRLCSSERVSEATPRVCHESNEGSERPAAGRSTSASASERDQAQLPSERERESCAPAAPSNGKFLLSSRVVECKRLSPPCKLSVWYTRGYVFIRRT